MTPAETQIVVRRAHGEYAVQDACDRIYRKYKRSEETIYMAFLAVVCRAKRETFDEFVAVAQPVLDAHPNFWRSIRPEKKQTKKVAEEPGEEVSADPRLKEERPPLRRGLKALKQALSEPWPTRGWSPQVEEDQKGDPS